MDAAGTEHPDGHLVIDGRPDRRGRRRPRARATSPARRRIDGARLPRHARPRQLPPPPLPVGDPRPRAGGDAVRVARRALSRVGAHRRRDRVAPPARAGLAALAAVGLHDLDRPPLRLPARRAATCSRSRSTRPRRSACASTRAAARWTSGAPHGGLPPDEVVEDRDAVLAACEAAIDRFHDPSPGRDGADRARARARRSSVTRELMARRRRARPPPRRAPAHPPRRDARRGGVLPGAVRHAPGRVPRRPRLARRRRLARALRPPRATPRSRASARPAPASRTAPSSNARLGAGIAPVAALSAAGAPVGLGVDGAASNEAGELAAEVRQALLVARLRGGPAALTARARARARHDRAAPAASAATTSSARSSPASSPTSRCGGSTASATPASPTRSPRSSSARRGRCDTLLVGGRAVVERRPSCARPTEQEITTDIARASRAARRAGWRRRCEHRSRRRARPASGRPRRSSARTRSA